MTKLNVNTIPSVCLIAGKYWAGWTRTINERGAGEAYANSKIE